MKLLYILVGVLMVAYYISADEELENQQEQGDYRTDFDEFLNELVETLTTTKGSGFEFIDDSDIIEKAIQSIENTADLINKIDKGAITPKKEMELLYNEIIDTLEDLADVLQEPDHAHEFLASRGIDRIIIPYMNVGHTKLRGLALTILKDLFNLLPTTADVIPITAIDKLLDIFENDDNLAMKAHALDVLYKWLPGNPEVQVRVMKLKGLEPFYEQVNKLDTSVISTLLDLFNVILSEHIKVRNDRKFSSRMDTDKLIMYQRIGLIERMSTPPVCNGLLNIFEATWSYSNDFNDVIAPVFELIKNMKPYCIRVLRGKNKAVKLFEAYLKYLEDENRKEYFDSLELNLTDTKLTLEDFLNELKQPPVKDEF